MDAKRGRYDVVVVGGGPVGSFLSWQLARAGRSVRCIEKGPRRQQGRRIGIIHFEEEAFLRLDIPLPPAEEILCVYPDLTFQPPLDAPAVRVPHLVNYAVRYPLFLERIQDQACKAGAELEFGCELAGLGLDSRGKPNSVTVRRDGGTTDLGARIVVDATGIAGAVRARLGEESLVEPGPIRDEDTFSVYMELWRNVRGSSRRGLTSFLECNGWWAPYGEDSAVIGVGVPGGASEARAVHGSFASRHFDLPHEVVRRVTGRIPYRRCPDSLVDDGVLVVGDSAAQNKPFNGEGISSAFAACRIAAEVVDQALARDDVGAASLWDYNTRYFRGQGAEFAAITAFAPTLLSLGPEELAELSTSGLIRPEDLRSIFGFHRLAPARTSELATATLRLLARRKSLLGKIAAGAANATAVSFLYRRYPTSPTGLRRWKTAAEIAWRRCGSLRTESS